jgi:hypothetical protein
MLHEVQMLSFSGDNMSRKWLEQIQLAEFLRIDDSDLDKILINNYLKKNNCATKKAFSEDFAKCSNEQKILWNKNKIKTLIIKEIEIRFWVEKIVEDITALRNLDWSGCDTQSYAAIQHFYETVPEFIREDVKQMYVFSTHMYHGNLVAPI